MIFQGTCVTQALEALHHELVSKVKCKNKRVSSYPCWFTRTSRALCWELGSGLSIHPCILPLFLPPFLPSFHTVLKFQLGRKVSLSFSVSVFLPFLTYTAPHTHTHSAPIFERFKQYHRMFHSAKKHPKTKEAEGSTCRYYVQVKPGPNMGSTEARTPNRGSIKI